MVQISGMTEAKIERFGAAFLDVLNSDGPEDTPLAPAKVRDSPTITFLIPNCTTAPAQR
jgi:hypothetical protein